jgi:outer membrane protein assembly factor BamB
MTVAQTDEPTPRKPLRLWPGVVAAVLVLAGYVVPIVVPEALIVGMLGRLAGALLIVLWWVLFSRAPWSERLGGLALIIIALAATPRILLHPSVAGGMMGFMFYMVAIPVLGLAFVAWAVATRRLPDGIRRVSMVATVLLACGAWALLRTGGISGEGASDLHWRWSETPEERLLAQVHDEPAPLPAAPGSAATPEKGPVAPGGAQAGEAPPALPAAPAALPATPEATKAPEKPAMAQAGEEPTAAPPAPATAPAAVPAAAEWPGFRGPRRDGVVRGVRIKTDWAASPPVELWRRPIGPGWSSFAVRGDFLYTQEQRGDDEAVSCYRVATGEPVWRHRDAVRFWESNAGAGPRGTPTLSDGRLYALGATGILNALDAGNGAVVWSRNVSSDTHVKVPGWGFASSPLVVDGLVVVAASGKLAAYDLATGEPRWFGPEGRQGYSSPHLARLGGVPQILFLNGNGATSLAPADGKVLWEHALPGGTRIVQPALTADGDVLVNDGEFGDGNHMRRIAVARGPAGWRVEERWSSMGLKPNFNDFVVHQGHAYGFDGSILSCIDLADGQRKWKGGRYGHGQLVLLADQDVLLVLSEQGELALVKATPDEFTELARFPAIQGKTWNHPALVGDVLLVRNGEEMAAFRLALAGD